MPQARFHFLRDYRRLVRNLIAEHPLPKAMSIAVGGSYEALGEVEKQLLIGLGLEPGHVLLDVGCGSGRLAKALVPYLTSGRFLGTDVVQELLDYARNGCPDSWQFALVEDIRIPFPDSSVDLACFFSVFTHLLHEESYCYLLEAKRVVKPGGKIVFSFLEYEHNWRVFEDTFTAILGGGASVHLNTFIGRDAIDAWTNHLGVKILEMHAATEPFIELSHPITYDDGRKVEGVAALGQSVCVLDNAKPSTRVPARTTSAHSGYDVKFRIS
ncbi:MAG TPA: methyltransferase domain-containing protein [Casimicrobiaceae bacterium]|nr:methyltransferase domain-containing protein [Casimicrobiaceae bacterium]